ncbi:unnamed protein product [Cylindrotheca closterium]|uniref:Uncharacterized protein n=1 Tax=Cylindrotheca closterium TaxID=2856 RepID=A0AAD2GCK4_9STRA|nr:unnamed protein product [Cylindrotheca closterium]
MDRKRSQAISEGSNVASGFRTSNQVSETANPLSNSFGFGDQANSADSEWTEFACEKNGILANPFRSKPSSPLTKEIGDSNARHGPKQMSPAGVVEDVPMDGSSQERAVNFVPQIVSRIMSEDTQDTNDTAPMSNRDPNRPPMHPASPNASNLNLDAFCSKYYNTPAGQKMHSTGSLGDFISPVESPIDDDEEEEEGEGARSAQIPSNEDARKMLEIPRMKVKLVRTASEASSLLGETLVEEKKTRDDTNESVLNGGSTAVSTSIQTPERGRTRTLVRPSQNQAHRDDGIVSETATMESASTFTALDEDKTRPLTPHAFFWRTFPNVTVTSDDIQNQNGSQQNRIQSRFQDNRAAEMAVLEAVRIAVQEHIRQHTVHIEHEELPPGSDCTPFVDQEVIKRLWMESRPSTMRMSGVFTRNEYHPPENLNFAMG